MSNVRPAPGICMGRYGRLGHVTLFEILNVYSSQSRRSGYATVTRAVFSAPHWFLK